MDRRGELGISREPRERRLRALEDLERGDLTRKLAAEHGVTPLLTPLPGMRGRLLTCGQNAAGVPMAYVLDEVNRRLAVMPAPPDVAGRWGGA